VGPLVARTVVRTTVLSIRRAARRGSHHHRQIDEAELSQSVMRNFLRDTGIIAGD